MNAGVSGETSSGGNGRIDWILRTPPDIFVLELGANDGLRGIPLAETKKNLQAIIDKVKASNPNVQLIIAGMMLPPNMGQQYTNQFRDNCINRIGQQPFHCNKATAGDIEAGGIVILFPATPRQISACC